MRAVFSITVDKSAMASLSVISTVSQLGSSYDWRDTGNSITTLVGKSRLQVGRADTAVVFDALPGWHGKDQIQLLQADMAVRLVGQDAFFADLQKRVDR